MSLFYTGIYALVAGVGIILAKGHRLRVFLIALGLGVVVNHCLSLTDFKRAAFANLRAAGLASSEAMRGIESYEAVIRRDNVYLLAASVLLSGVALAGIVRKQRASPELGSEP